MLIDSHAHLDDKRFGGDLDAVIARAREAGVGFIICAGVDLESSRRCIELAARYAGVYATAGVHPHEAARAPRGYTDALRALAALPKVTALGEMGLDYHYDHSPRRIQREVFAAQLALARELDAAVVVHSRKADEDTYRILAESGVRRAVLHCFSGNWRQAQRYLELGFYISLSGVVTFPKSADTRAVAAKVPSDRLMLETDAPYLAPVPRRGRRNEPAYVRHTAEAVAGMRGVTLEELARQTTANVRRFFGMPETESGGRVRNRG